MCMEPTSKIGVIEFGPTIERHVSAQLEPFFCFPCVSFSASKSLCFVSSFTSYTYFQETGNMKLIFYWDKQQKKLIQFYQFWQCTMVSCRGRHRRGNFGINRFYTLLIYEALHTYIMKTSYPIEYTLKFANFLTSPLFNISNGG